MSVRKLAVRLSVLAGAILVTVFALGQQAKRVDDAALKNASRTGDDWPSYGQNPGETRYSPLNQINAGNVNRLGLAWSFEVGPGGDKQEATPLEWNGVLYLETNWSVAIAVDARTGKEKWRWDPEVNRAAVRPKLACCAVQRGVAIYNGKVIVPIIDGRLIALDMETGKPVWESRVSYTQDDYSITMAPRIAKGKVIIGVGGAEYPTRGYFDAYDANTGKFAWRFYTIPGDPSKPFENPALEMAAKTWSGDWWKLGGGGSVWDGMTYDPDTNLLYVATGNGGPWPEELRKSHGKDNLFVCSILAVNPDNGQLKWYFQVVPGDSWDYDSVQQMILADITVKGQPRKVLMQASKNGFYYVLDRVTGKFISGQPFAEVNWAKGLDEATGRPIENKEARYGTEAGVPVMPSSIGAHNWSPMSFNPNTGLVYIPTTATSVRVFAREENYNHVAGRPNRGIVMGPGVQNLKVEPAPPKIGPTPPEANPGILLAWDPVTQQARWHAPGGGGSNGGTVTTAGNLVFQVLADGHLMAYSADKGEKLLDVATGIPSGLGPPMTYMLDGKQYVAFMGGIGTLYTVNRPARAPAAGAPAPVTPKLLVFALDGKAPLPTAQ